MHFWMQKSKLVPRSLVLIWVWIESYEISGTASWLLLIPDYILFFSNNDVTSQGTGKILPGMQRKKAAKIAQANSCWERQLENTDMYRRQGKDQSKSSWGCESRYWHSLRTETLSPRPIPTWPKKENHEEKRNPDHGDTTPDHTLELGCPCLFIFSLCPQGNKELLMQICTSLSGFLRLYPPDHWFMSLRRDLRTEEAEVRAYSKWDPEGNAGSSCGNNHRTLPRSFCQAWRHLAAGSHLGAQGATQPVPSPEAKGLPLAVSVSLLGPGQMHSAPWCLHTDLRGSQSPEVNVQNCVTITVTDVSSGSPVVTSSR